MKKINTKFFILFAIFGVFWVLGQTSSAHASFSDEGTAFYAQAHPSAYAIEGIAFYAYTTQVDGTIPVYRSYNSTIGDHFYTTSDTEKDSPGYLYEGIAFYAYATQVDGTIPVYRFNNNTIGDHFYTASLEERDTLDSNSQWGYVDEGVAFYIFSSQVDGTSAVYRFFNASTGDHFYTASTDEKNSVTLSPVYRFVNASSGKHFYTASENEKSILANSSHGDFLFEGIAFYAYTTQVDGTVPVYRSSNASTGDHLYTTSDSEKNASGYTYEGIAFYAYVSQLNGSSPVYRLVSNSTGEHFYTISADEKNNLVIGVLGPNISVGLWDYSKSDLTSGGYFKIDANKKYNIKDKNGNVIATVDGGTTTKVSYDSSGYLKVSGSISSQTVKTAVNFDAADDDNSSLIFNVNRPSSSYDHYRGKIKVQNTDSSNIWVINTLPLEQYVWGAGEFTGTGPYEHTKVMATIYRTYGYWYIEYATKYNQYGFTIRGDSGSQIYYGYDHENQYSNVPKSAKDTRGVIATYKGDVALTPYCSWSDGHTRSFEEVWGSTDYPWCQSVDDPYGKNDSMTTAQLQAAGNHMVGLIANGSLDRANHGWNYSKILKYYYTGISLNPVY